MYPDIPELTAFYAGRDGQIPRRLIAHRIRQLWPEVTDLIVVGIGHAAPYLDLFESARSAVALMPGCGNAAMAKLDPSGRTALVAEDCLPLADGSVDRLLLVHALECSRESSRLLREAWRVLADGGRLLAVVPNRRGLWCLSERTPFGVGQPYSSGQLSRALKRHLFEPLAEGRALYLPPFRSRLLQRTAVPAERLGLRFARQFSGVVMIEAEKRIYVGTPLAVGAPSSSRRRYVAAPEVAMAAREWQPARAEQADAQPTGRPLAQG